MKAVTLLVLVGMDLALPGSAAALTTHTVVARVATSTFVATGTVEAVRQATLSAQVAGRISEVFVHNGDTVRTGQTLIRIAASEAKDVTAATLFGAAGSQARLASASADYERAQRLRQQDFLSIAAMQRAEAAWRSAEAEASASEAQARAATERADWYTIKAPFSGRVTDLHVSVGDLATPGRALVGMYDPSALRLIAHVPEILAAQLMPTKQAYLASSSIPGSATHTELTDWWVIPSVDSGSHSVEVRAQLQAGNNLQPGQFARIVLPLHSVTTELHIPLAAVVRRSEVTGAYVIGRDGNPHLRQLRLGPENGNDVLVLSGLQSGEQVVLDRAATAIQ